MTLFHLTHYVLAIGVCSGECATASPAPSRDSAFLEAALLGDGSRCGSVSSSGAVEVWDLRNGKKLKSISRSPCLSVAVSPDGRQVVCGGWDGAIAIVDLATEKEVLSFATGDKRPVGGVVWSPEGTHIISTDKEKGIHLWDAQTAKKMRTFTLEQPLACLAISPDAKALLLGPALRGDPNKAEDFSVHLLDLRTGAIRRSFAGHTEGVACVGYSPDGRLAFGGVGNGILIWDVATGKLKHKLTLGPPGKLLSSATFTADSNTLLTAGMGLSIQLTDIRTGKSLLKCGSPTWSRAVISADGKRILGFANDLLVQWDAKTGEEILTLAGGTTDPRSPISWLAACPGRPYLLARDVAAAAVLWDYRTGKVVRSFADKRCAIAEAGFTPDGKHLLSSDENGGRGPFYQTGSRLRLWDVSKGTVTKSFSHNLTFDAPVAVSPDGKVAAVGLPGAVGLIDVSDGRTVRSFPLGDGRRIAHPLFTPDGSSLLAWGGGPVVLWRVRDGRLIRRLDDDGDAMRAAAVSPDGRLLAMLNGRFALYEVATGKPARVLSGKDHPSKYRSVAFSPAGSHLLSGRADGVIELWDARTGAVLRQFVGKGAPRWVHAVVFLDEGKLAASGHDDGVIRIWNVATGKEIRQLKKSL